MAAYYNEIDKFAAAWLRELIKAGLIADGEVDERSIEDVIPSELMGFSQYHFFAGIGGWSAALRLAGWFDDKPVWTGSCPCQPFSAAGKGGGTSDERHLWPAFEWLIRQCRPDVIFGEQVEAAIKHDWLDHVALSLEGIGYAVGAVGFPACSVGAPHIRQRLYWVADSKNAEWRRSANKSNIGWRFEEIRGPGAIGYKYKYVSRNTRMRLPRSREQRICENLKLLHYSQSVSSKDKAKRNVRNFWDNSESVSCKDGNRPVEPGTFPLAHGVSARVGRLRGYGNAIVPEQAAAFIKAYMETF